ncbi:hypothetical protein LTR78_010149 [Recurvomyces mirabilis]|uniref:Uncharacterized protein n=1 Tax=Recurvomyces mirabilis TaxID=574656 RepID=A0AAE0TMW3_9PEZI|nr:hypothetical protein LTR78_010149 [Recurvomyces mirabilis]KAK5149940.1 hypothetical protein LTS14_010545 [Recurvomyces mirabilis]
MAPIIQSYESQDLINVSQDARTSPASQGSVVEDSLGVATRGGPAQHVDRDHAEADQGYGADEEELYGVSPPRLVVADAAESFVRETAQGAPEFATQPPKTTHSAPKPVRNEELNGITVRSSHVASHYLDDHSTNEEEEGDTASAQDIRRKSSGRSTSKSVSSAASSKAKAKPHISAPTSVMTKAKATPTSNNSAFAALQARRNGSAIAGAASTVPKLTSTSESTAPPKVRATQAIRKALADKDKNARAPALEMAVDGIDEKPKSRKLGMLAVTPARIIEKTMTQTGETADHQKHARSSAVLDKNSKSKLSTAEASKATSTARYTGRNTAPAAKVTVPSLDDFYDVPLSPPGKQATNGKIMPEIKSQQPSKKQEAEKRSSHALENKTRGRPRKRPIAEDSDDYVDAPVRVQPAKSAQAAAAFKRRKAAPPKAAPPKATVSSSSSTKVDEEGMDFENDHESIEDFEHAVTHVDKEGNGLGGIRIEKGETGMVDGSVGELADDDSPRAEKTARRANVANGASQDNAILLSDREDCSSELDETELMPAKPKARLRPSAKAVKAPQTPAAPSSSPPNCDPDQAPKPLADVEASRCSTIIGFDRSGPRNQGTRSVKKPAAGTPWHDQTAGILSPRKIMKLQRSTLARVDAHHGLGPSSAVGSMRSHRKHRTDRRAQPENVAADVIDALSGLLGHAKASAGDIMPELRTRTEIAAWGGHDQDEGFQLIDDALPAPVAATRGKALDEWSVSTQPPLPRTASQVAMPPPAPKHSKFATLDVPAAIPVTNALMATREVQTHARPATKTSKRASSDDKDLEAPVSKKKRSRQAVQNSVPDPTVDFPTQPKPTRRALQAIGKSKVGRQASQGNVDVGGSPIPRDMVVPEHSTALEIFSQQAGLSSDSAPAQPKPSSSISTTSVLPTGDPSFFDHLLSIPSYQPQQLASNDKRKPTSPGQESKAMTGIAMRRLDGQRLVIHDELGPPPTNPFASSEAARGHLRKESSSSQLAEKLRQQTAPCFRKRKSDAVEVEDPQKTLVEEVPKLKKQNSTKSVRLETAMSAEDDPDRTLVEGLPITRKRIATKAAKTVQRGGSVPAEEEWEMSAIGFWRNGLQNYQVNMFDELVGISHKLMRHLVDRETAMREAVSDYRRQGLNMIVEMERRHAREYKASVKKLEERKEKMRGDLNAISERLQDAVAVMAQKRGERRETGRKLDKEEGRLVEILAGLC